jgi:hypothetical protein
MTSNAPIPLKELRASLVSIAYCCPVDSCNPEDCPLFLLRKLPPADRVAWLDGLNMADAQYLSFYHHVCMRLKLEQSCAPAQPLPKSGLP